MPRSLIVLLTAALALLAGWWFLRPAENALSSRSGKSVPAVVAATSGAPGKVAAESPAARQDLAWRQEVAEQDFAAFRAWTQRYAAAAAPERETWLDLGVRLAKVRRAEFAKLMRASPARALELAVPETVRRTLPAEVLAQLETPVDARGDLEHYAAIPAPGAATRPRPDFYEVRINGARLRAYVTAARAEQPSRYRVPIHGYKLDDEIVVRPTAGRLLEPVEVAEARTAKGGAAICPTSEQDTRIHQDEAGVSVAGRVELYCSTAHAESELEALTAAEQDAPVAAEGEEGGEVLAASAHTEGVKRLLIIRIDFSDYTNAPISEATGNNVLTRLNSAWTAWSYGRCTLDVANSEVTTQTIRMPNPVAYYNDAAGTLYDHALAAATAAGYNLSNYHFRMVAMDSSTPGFGWAGLGTVGGNKSWVRAEGETYFASVAIHELGHNLGLNHAQSYTVGGPNPIASGGTTSEYGDIYDAVGGGDIPDSYNARYKLYLNWLTGADFTTAAGSGVYRLAAHDKSTATGVRALRVNRTGSQDYHLEYRTERTGSQAGPNDNGVQVRWGPSGTGNGKTQILDMTSGSGGGLHDAPLALGKTFADTTYGVYLTPMAKIVGAAFDSMDVLVSLPANALPPLWSSADIGPGGATGLASAFGGGYFAHGAGADIWGTADEFRFTQQMATGDCDFRARVTAQANTNTWAKAGVMLRNGTAAGAAHAALYVSPGNGFAFQYRAASGGTTTNVAGPALGAAPNNWVRLTRAGNTVRAYVSANGTTWTQVGSAVTIGMEATINAGLAVCSHVSGTLGAAAFDHVSLADSATLTTTLHDTFDVGTATANNDSADPLDTAWRGSAATLAIASDTTLASGKAVNVDATGTFASLRGAFAGRTLAALGDSLRLSFDFRYTQTPANTASGLRFGLFNSAGQGFCAHHGTGGNGGYALLEDANGGFGTGSLTSIASSAKATLNDQAKHTATFTLRKTADGVNVTAVVDGITVTGTDTSPVLGAFDTVSIANGNLVADFRVDNLRVEYAHVAPPAWTANPFTKATGAAGVAYTGSLAADLTAAGAAVTFSKLSGPAWLEVATDGALSGTPAAGNLGANHFSVRATNELGQSADAALSIHVAANVVTVTASDASASEEDLSTGTFLLSRSGATTGALTVNFTASGTAQGGADYVALGISAVIPAGQTSVPVTVTPLDDDLLEAGEIVVLALASSANYSTGSPASATVTIADDESLFVRLHDAFDTSGATPGDDANDPSDAAWTASAAALSVASDATLGTGHALDVAATGTFALARSSFAARSLPNNGDALTFSFDFRYTTLPPASGNGFRFGLFNGSGDGFFFTNGTGGTAGVALSADHGADGGYGSGGTTNGVSDSVTGAPFSLNDTARHAASLTVRKLASGLSVVATIDGVTVTGTDTAPVVTTFNTVVVRNGGINASFRIDNAHVEFAPNVAPAFTANPLAKPGAIVGAVYAGTLAGDASDANPGDAITFSKISGPAWLSVAPDGALGGTPGGGDAGVNQFVVRATDDYGRATDATLVVVVGYPVTVAASVATAQEQGGVPGNFVISRGGPATSSLAVFFVLSGTAEEGVDYFSPGSSVVIPAGQTSVSVALAPIDDEEFDENETVILTLADDAGYVVAVPDRATVSIADNEFATELVHDTFDIGVAPTAGDDADDSADAAWLASSATLSLAADATLGSENALHVDATGTFALIRTGIGAWSLPANGDALTLTFDFRYTAAPASASGGFRFGLFNSVGDGFFAQNGTGGTGGIALTEDVNADGGFGAGTASGVSGSVAGTPFSLNDTGTHRVTFTLRKVAAGIVITAAIDGVTITGTDPTPVTTSFDTLAIRNGNLNADFRVDNVRVVLTRNRLPFFAGNPIVKAAAYVGVAYGDQTLTADAGDPNPGDDLTFAKVSGPAWLNVAMDGTLSGTPGLAHVGGNTFIVRVTDSFGLAADATLSIAVVDAPIERWRQQHFGAAANDPLVAGNFADPDEDGAPNVLEFALDGDPNSASSSGRTFARIRAVGGSEAFTFTIAARSGASFTSVGGRMTAMIEGIVYVVEATPELEDWELAAPVAEVIPAHTEGLPFPGSGWQYHTFRCSNSATAAPVFFRARVEAP